MREEKDVSQLRKADVVASIFLFIFAVLFLIGALIMPAKIYVQTSGQASGIYTAPGLLPILISLILILESVLLFRIGNKGVEKISVSDLKRSVDYLRSAKFQRLAVAVGLLVIYIFALLGRIRYDLATFIYLFCNMIIFRNKGYSIMKILIVCVLFSLGIANAFKFLFKIPLP